MEKAKGQYLHVHHDDFLRRRPSKNSNSAIINLIYPSAENFCCDNLHAHTISINVIELFYIYVGWANFVG
jgi:hypothetical protein